MRWLIARGEQEEAVAHALFDLMQLERKPTDTDDILALIERYQTSAVM